MGVCGCVTHVKNRNKNPNETVQCVPVSMSVPTCGCVWGHTVQELGGVKERGNRQWYLWLYPYAF